MSGFSAHTKLRQYGGSEINGAGELRGDTFSLPEHFRQNFLSPSVLYSGIFIATKEHSMFDLVMLAVALILFAMTIAYAYACDRL